MKKTNKYNQQINAINKLKIALVHESFIEYGGAEKLLSRFIDLFPEADIYVTIADPNVGRKVTNKKYRTTFLNRIPIINRKHSFAQLFGFLFEKFRVLYGYDLVIASSCYGTSCLIRTDAVKVDYMQSLPKNIYGLVPKWKIQKVFPYTSIFRNLINSRLKNSDVFIANSQHCQKWFNKEIGREPIVIYPPIKIPPRSVIQTQSSDYFVTASRLSLEKNVELIIQVFNKTGLHLKIVGTGSDEERLKRIARPNIEFLGFVEEKKLYGLFAKAKGFIFAAENEDFGMAPIEAITCGCPVIVYARGGPLEYVEEGVNGVLFHKQTVTSLMRAVSIFNRKYFDRHKVARTASRFSLNNFNHNLVGVLSKALREKKLL